MRQKLGCISINEFESDIVLYVHNAKENIGSYLYPCIIEYSLMCMTIFFILWQSIEHRYIQVKKRSGSLNRELIGRDDSAEGGKHRDVNHFTINFAKSTTGLFFGILVMLLTIISLITYFIYKQHNTTLAKKLSEATELFLLVLSLIVVIAIYVELNYYKFSHKLEESFSYNAILEVVGLAGIYTYDFYSIIAILDNGLSSEVENISMAIHILSVLESTLQSVLIINALNMYTKQSFYKKKMPARSLITLLILIDVSLWLTGTLSIKKYEMNEMQLEYYNIVFWSITSSIATPLAIFFRFHSSVCLSDIWKTLYD